MFEYKYYIGLLFFSTVVWCVIYNVIVIVMVIYMMNQPTMLIVLEQRLWTICVHPRILFGQTIRFVSKLVKLVSSQLIKELSFNNCCLKELK